MKANITISATIFSLLIGWIYSAGVQTQKINYNEKNLTSLTKIVREQKKENQSQNKELETKLDQIAKEINKISLKQNTINIKLQHLRDDVKSIKQHYQ